MKIYNLIKLTIVIQIVSSGLLFAQEESTIERNRTSIFLQIAGQQIIGLHVNSLISERVSINGSLGIILDASVGANYYAFKNGEIGSQLYIGIRVEANRELNFIFGHNSPVWVPGLHIPLGYEFKAKKGFTLQVEAGPNFAKDLGQINTSPILVSLKLGITPKKKKNTTINK